MKTKAEIKLHVDIKQPIILSGEQHDYLCNNGWELFRLKWVIAFKKEPWWKFWSGPYWYFKKNESSVEGDIMNALAKNTARRMDDQVLGAYFTTTEGDKMRRQQIEEQVIALVKDQLAVEKVSLDSHLCDDLNADSLDVVELTMTAEETFDIDIKDEDAEKSKTVKDLVELVVKAKATT